MKKKALIGTAATAALLAASPGIHKADAAANNLTATKEKVYYYQSSNFNNNDINSFLEKFIKEQGIQWSFNDTPIKQSVPRQANQIKVPAPAKQEVSVQKPGTNKTAAPAQPVPAVQTSSQLSAYEQKVVDLTNQERAKNGLPALKVDLALSKMARDKSKDMQANHYFDHTSPTYGSPFDMMKKYGISYTSAGENIAMGQKTPEEVVNAWMNSEGHRRNILNSNFTNIGVGYVAKGNYWTQEFIGK
ncbi:CAP domain-containing protein [Neobacillus terrae]|uniref:CAP domain-containing protein n=1 Tax=Neobacillus terrae TaxID=3034837 RepID=UPI001408D893|nr:CAP domain-containing protein [Neobacillus terrae]NHM29340.1 sporulation protein [Neobacillus terrae]